MSRQQRVRQHQHEMDDKKRNAEQAGQAVLAKALEIARATPAEHLTRAREAVANGGAHAEGAPIPTLVLEWLEIAKRYQHCVDDLAEHNKHGVR